MPKKFAIEEPVFGSFTPFDPHAPPLVLEPEPLDLPMPEAVTAVPNVFPAGQTYEGFLYGLIQGLDTGSGGFTATITTPASGDTLIYNSGTGVFENVAPAATPFLPLAGGTLTGALGITRTVTAAPASMPSLTITPPAFTAVGTGVTVCDVDLALSRTLQLATGARALVKGVNVTGVTYSAVAASTIDEAVGVFINAMPVAGTNATLTQCYALYVNGPTKFVSGTTGGTDVVWVLPTDNTPVGAAVGRIPIQIGGAIKYIPYHSA